MSQKPPFDWPGLQIAEEYEAQRRGWVIDRAGWTVMLVILVLALTGFFGNGPIGLSTTTDQTGFLEAEYNRFGRNGADLTLTVQVREEGVRNDEYAVWIANDYLEGVTVDDISPVPSSVEILENGQLYSFMNKGGDLQVIFDLTGDTIGSLRGVVGLNGPAGAAGFSQFLYP